MTQQHLGNIRHHTQAVSVVIGALMLTVIVVTAATSFAIFTAQKQEEIQKADYLNTLQDLEDISISNFFFNDTRINITIHNDWTKTSIITGIQINNGWWKNDTQLSQKNHLDSYDSTQLNISYNNIYYDEYKPTENKPLIINIHTNNGNDFETIYHPPNAIIKLNYESLWNGTAYKNYQILDGSQSNHPQDGYIVNWTWTNTSHTYYGQKIQPTTPIDAGDTITLIVTDNYGMKASRTLLI